MAYEDDDDQLSRAIVPNAMPVPLGTSLTPTSMPALAARPLDVGTQGDFAARGPQIPAAPVMATPPKGPTPIGGDKLSQDQAELQRLQSTGSGVDQFGQHHNKFLAGLAHVADAIGGAMFPSIAQAIPGTSLHHQVLVGRAQNAVNEDQAAQFKQAQIGEQQAHARQETAKANALDNPQAKPKEEEWQPVQGMQGPNGEPVMYEKNSGQIRIGDAKGVSRVPKEEEEGKTVTTADGVMQWNPQTRAYDKRVGDAPEKPGNDFEQYYKDFLSDHKAPDNAHNRLLARQQYSAASQPPQREPQQMMVVPTADGGQQVVSMKPGMVIPKGGMTVSGFTHDQQETNKETGAQKKALQDSDNELGLMRQFAANPSATNDSAMLMHFIGATKPESMGKIRLNDRELKLFGGTRSSLGDVQALFQKVQNGQSLTPQQRKDMVSTMTMINGALHRNSQPSAAPAAGGIDPHKDPMGIL